MFKIHKEREIERKKEKEIEREGGYFRERERIQYSLKTT